MIGYHELSNLINAFALKYLIHITFEMDQWIKTKYYAIPAKSNNINKIFVDPSDITAKKKKSKKRFKIEIKKTKMNFLTYQKNTNNGCIFFKKK